MEIKSRAGKVIFSAAAIAVFLWFLVWTTKSVVAHYLARDPRLPRLELAARLVPGDSNYQRFLGRYYLYTLEEMDFAKAEGYFRRAAELNPHEPDIWLELASALEYQGKFDAAEQAYLRATSLAPANPRINWPAGQFFLRHERFDAAVPHFRVVLAGTNRYNRTLFETAWKALDDPDQILGELIPSHRETEIAYLNYLSEKQRFDAAKKVWKRVIAHPEPLEPRYAGPYINRLVGARMGAAAHEAWRELLANQPDLFHPSGEGNLIVNGDFEGEPLGFGFDWRAGRINGAVMEYDRSVFRSPGRSALIRFRGESNISYRHFSQWVKVDPRKRYRFQASMRTEGITTDSGPLFEIIDPVDISQLREFSDDLVGTWGWQTVTIDFRTGSTTEMILLRVVRRPSRKLDNLISGKVWIDDVSITPL